MSSYKDRGGRRPWRGSSGSTSSRGPIRTPPAPPLGLLLEQLIPAQCSDDDNGTKFLASYNWTDARNPSILFPGTPPLWDPPAEATRLPEDSGKYFKDQNAARHPTHPMEPAVKAVLTQNLHFDTGNVDVFGCTSTLGNLLRFLKNDDKSFRFTVEALGRTVFFVRRENAPDELIAGPRGFGPTGHGHAFPDRYTRWPKGVEDSASHQRIISYKFAGLRCLVRFEADGYLEKELGRGYEDDTTISSGHDDDAARAIPVIDNVQTHNGGRLIPQHAIFELKTRGAHKRNDDQMSDHLPRMWQAQIPFFILAFHEYGLFKPADITIQDVRKKVAAWQDENQQLLRRLSVLLGKLVSIARDPAIGRYEVCVQQRGVLEIREPGGTVSSPLASPLTWIWADQDVSDSGESSNGVSVGTEAGDADVATHSDADDDNVPEDFTACTDACDYCGRCSYKLR
ncbi:hypothetical protein LTR49_027563 [Elasticomyces elasticus]|nr:hypothetical protein LTR49_027563 [Elasticomyces elasticus]